MDNKKLTLLFNVDKGIGERGNMTIQWAIEQ